MIFLYDDKLSILPQSFESKKVSRYLAAMELLSRYKSANYMFDFVVQWLNSHKNENGKWDMGKTVIDKVYFPLSDDWRKRKKERRIVRSL